jgi:hypothetical protein
VTERPTEGCLGCLKRRLRLSIHPLSRLTRRLGHLAT